MGWDFSHKAKGVKTAEYLAAEFPSLTFHAHATVGSTFYAAAESSARPGVIFGLVVLTQRSRDPYYNFGYKDMSESMGPYESEAPAKVLDLLTPTDSEHALAWRERCRAHAARLAKVKTIEPGDLVVTDEPIRWTGTGPWSIYRASPKRGRYALAYEDGTPASSPIYSISDAYLAKRAFSVIKSTVAA